MDKSRTSKLIGESGVDTLARSRVLVCGLGGVGSYAVEALARAGVGYLDLLDCDTVEPSNANRQLFALVSTFGRAKADVAAERVLDINPSCRATPYRLKLDAETVKTLNFSLYDYVVDAVDDTAAKVLLALACQSSGTPLIACMGTGNRIRADFGVKDIYETKNCPLARAMRAKYRAAEIHSLAVVSTEEESLRRDGAPGSVSYVPPLAGLKCAEYVLTRLLEKK